MTSEEGVVPLTDPRELLLASTVQALFQEHGLSLNDPRTADAFRVSLRAARWAVGGALASGLLEREAFDEITDHFDAMERSPDLL